MRDCTFTPLQPGEFIVRDARGDIARHHRTWVAWAFASYDEAYAYGMRVYGAVRVFLAFSIEQIV